MENSGNIGSEANNNEPNFASKNIKNTESSSDTVKQATTVYITELAPRQ